MKKLLALAMCALFALNAEARTLYVDASRPNNKGNGLSVKKAKKTIQAAVNAAKNGDTIIVLKGTYAAALKTNNKKLRIKSKAGADATTITPKNWALDNHLLNLGNGNATSMSGFAVSSSGYTGGVKGGALSNCKLSGFGNTYKVKWTFSKTKLTDCLLNNCTADTFGNFITGSTLTRCKLTAGNSWAGQKVVSTKFCNSLLSEGHLSLSSCVLANCTVADSDKFSMKSTKAYNTIFHKVASSQFKKSKKNALKNCYKGDAPGFSGKVLVGAVVEWETDDDWGSITVSGSSDSEIEAAARAQIGADADIWIEERQYEADYHLQAGSPCIDKGTKAKAAKKLYGKKDLDGKKRVKGKSVDIGCYEY